MKKLLATLLALIMVMSIAGAVAEVTFPLSDEVITLTAFATAGPYTKGDFNDLRRANAVPDQVFAEKPKEEKALATAPDSGDYLYKAVVPPFDKAA